MPPVLLPFEAIAVECNVVLEPGDLFEGILVAPDDVLFSLLANADGPVGCIPLEGAEGFMIAPLEELHPNIVARKIDDWFVLRLDHDECALTVGYCRTVEPDANPFRAWLEIDPRTIAWNPEPDRSAVNRTPF